MKDTGTAGLRERVWVTKVDHETDPPRIIEEMFIENGRIVSVTRAEPKQEEKPDEQQR